MSFNHSNTDDMFWYLSKSWLEGMPKIPTTIHPKFSSDMENSISIDYII